MMKTLRLAFLALTLVSNVALANSPGDPVNPQVQSLVVGGAAPTGGGEGDGSINAKAIYINGVPVGGSYTISTGLTLTGSTLTLGDSYLAYGAGAMAWQPTDTLCLVVSGCGSGNQAGLDLAMTTNGIGVNTGFADVNAFAMTLTANSANNYQGGLTSNKTSLSVLNLTENSIAAGQKILSQQTLNGYGMGDDFLYSQTLQFAGGPISGDEGQGISPYSVAEQQTTLVATQIQAVSTTTCNTTLTQAVTGSPTAQTVTVASASGCSATNWVAAGLESPTNSPNMEGVQITAVGAGTITGIFHNNHNNGDPITPAPYLTVTATTKFGQGRLLVNDSATGYSTGTAYGLTAFTSGALYGVGTSWSNSMVSGTTSDIGCITLAADNYTGSPFSGSNIAKAWYEIQSVVSSTQVNILSNSVAGDTSYKGNGQVAGAYNIQPCARILQVVDNTHVVVSGGAFWAAYQYVEVPITPYEDFTGVQENGGVWLAGGTNRYMHTIHNIGARTFQGGLFINGGGAQSSIGGGGGADSVGFSRGLTITYSSLGEILANNTLAAFEFYTAANGGGTVDNNGYLCWGNAPATTNTGVGSNICLGTNSAANVNGAGGFWQMVSGGYGGLLAAYPNTGTGEATIALEGYFDLKNHSYGTTFDPTGVTQNQTITIPNESGTTDTLALLNTAQTFGAVKTFGAGDIVLTGAGGGCASFASSVLQGTSYLCGQSPSSITVGSGSVSPFGSVNQAIYVCTGTCNITLPGASGTVVIGAQFCVLNNDAVNSIITVIAPSSVQLEQTNFNGYKSAAASIASAGAYGDKICYFGKDATHYNVGAFNGTWL